MYQKSNWANGLFLIISVVATGYYIYDKVSLTLDANFYDVSRLSNLDIASILIESGDIPNDFYPGEITHIKPSDFPDNYYKFVQSEEQKILTNNKIQVGEVAIDLFESKKERDKAFEFLSLVESQEGIIPYEVAGIGECESCSPFATDYDMVFVFTRCASLAYIRIDLEYLQKGYDFDYLVAHAKRIDEQLKQIVCQQP